MQKVDPETVKALELTAPGACEVDRQRLCGQIRSGKIFGAFDNQDREAIWRKVLEVSTDRLIPSLFSFFEDQNYLQVLVECVRRLIEPFREETFSSALERSFA